MPETDTPMTSLSDLIAKARAAKPRAKKVRSAAQQAATEAGARKRDAKILSEEEKAAAKPRRTRATKPDGDPTEYRGRTTYLTRVNPAGLKTDAAAYQYKGKADGQGVTDRLEGVKSWDATRAGVMLVHERADGTRYVIDGHQRTGLARRLEATGNAPVSTPAIVFREADGWADPKELRAIAAAKNIAEGSGDMIDAARVFRDAPDVADDANLPPGSALVKGARGLARLSEDAWGGVVNGVYPPEHGAIVGLVAKDRPDAHGAILDVLKKSEPRNAAQATQIARETLTAGFSEGRQDSLFGPQTINQPLIVERAAITDSAVKSLAKDASALMTAARRAEILEDRADNTIDADATAAAGQADRQLAGVLRKVVSTPGSHAWRVVQEAATDVGAMRMTRRTAAARVARDLRTAFEAGGLKGLMDGPPEGGFVTRERRRRREPDGLFKAGGVLALLAKAAKRGGAKGRERSAAKTSVAVKRQRFPKGHPKAGQFMPTPDDAPKVRADRPKRAAPVKMSANPLDVPQVRQRLQDYADNAPRLDREIAKRAKALDDAAGAWNQARDAVDVAERRARLGDEALGRAMKAAALRDAPPRAKATQKRAATIAQNLLSAREAARTAEKAARDGVTAAAAGVREARADLDVYRQLAARAVHVHAGRPNRYDYPGDWQKSLDEADRLARRVLSPRIKGMGR